MRFNIATTLFVLIGAAQAASRPDSQLCGSEEECKINCKDGIYHTETTQGSTYLACTVEKDLKYSIGSCFQERGQVAPPPKPEALRALCESVNGELCTTASGCIFVQTESRTHDYHSGCSIDANGSSSVSPSPSYELLERHCERIRNKNRP